MSVTIPIDLFRRPFIPLPRFFNSRRGVGDLLFLTHPWPYFHNNLPEQYMMCVHFENFIGLLCIIVLTWHFFPWLSPLLYSIVIKSSFMSSDVCFFLWGKFRMSIDEFTRFNNGNYRYWNHVLVTQREHNVTKRWVSILRGSRFSRNWWIKGQKIKKMKKKM